MFIDSSLCFSLSCAEAKDRAVDGSFPVKREGGEVPQPQGDGTGKTFWGCRGKHIHCNYSKAVQD